MAKYLLYCLFGYFYILNISVQEIKLLFKFLCIYFSDYVGEKKRSIAVKTFVEFVDVFC